MPRRCARWHCRSAGNRPGADPGRHPARPPRLGGSTRLPFRPVPHGVEVDPRHAWRLQPSSNLKPAPAILLVILLTRRVACPVSAPDTGLSILAPCQPFPSAPAAFSPPGASLEDRLMGAVVALDRLLDGRQLWRGPARQGPASDHLASGHPALDARLPGGGWPASGLCEVLQAAPGVGELALVWPVLARLSQRERPIVLVAPPYPRMPRPGPQPDWTWRGCRSSRPHRSRHCGPPNSACALPPARRCCVGPSRPTTGPCAGCRWPPTAASAWASCSAKHRRPATPPRPACACSSPGQVRVLKCRGGLPPAQPLPLAIAH